MCTFHVVKAHIRLPRLSLMHQRPRWLKSELLKRARGLGAGEDPSADVKKLITDSSEANHKSYRDDELTKAGDEKVDRETQVQTHSSKLEAAVSKFNVLNGAVAELRSGLCALSAQQLKTDAMRVDEQKILTNEYLDKQKPDCMNSGITHADSGPRAGNPVVDGTGSTKDRRPKC